MRGRWIALTIAVVIQNIAGELLSYWAGILGIPEVETRCIITEGVRGPQPPEGSFVTSCTKAIVSYGCVINSVIRRYLGFW